MSGVEASRKPKEPQLHACSSCVKTVLQTFTHFQEQIALLKQEKGSLQEELRKLREEYEDQKRIMAEEVRALEERLALLTKSSETHI